MWQPKCCTAFCALIYKYNTVDEAESSGEDDSEDSDDSDEDSGSEEDTDDSEER